MPNVQALREKRADELKKAAAIQEKPELSAEDLSAAKAHLAEAKRLGDAIDTFAQIEVDVSNLDKSAGRKAPAEQPSATVNVERTSISTHDRVQDNPTRGYDGVGGFGRFAADVHAFNTGRGASRELLAAAGDGLSVGLTSEGGVLVPPAFSTAIQDRMGVTSNNLMNEVDVLPALPYGVESMEYPVVNETSRADGWRAGGIQGRWKAELTEMSASKPTFKSIKFEPHQLYVLCYVSDKLLRNAPQLEQFLSTRAADEINFKVGDAIINGNGSAQPRGVLEGATDRPRVQIAKETGQAAATINITNLEKMYARMPARYLSGAKWYVNQDVWPALLSMQKAVGTGGVPVFMPGNNISGAPYGTIYGLPVVPLEYCATLGTEGDIILANMKAYAVQSRGGIDSAMSIHLKFDFAQTAFRFIFEIDGQPWLDQSITPFKGTAKQSPFITLATRA